MRRYMLTTRTTIITSEKIVPDMSRLKRSFWKDLPIHKKKDFVFPSLNVEKFSITSKLLLDLNLNVMETH